MWQKLGDQQEVRVSHTWLEPNFLSCCLLPPTLCINRKLDQKKCGELNPSTPAQDVDIPSGVLIALQHNAQPGWHFEVEQSFNYYIQCVLWRIKKSLWPIVGLRNIHMKSFLVLFMESGGLFIISYFYGFILIFWFLSCHTGYFTVLCCYWFLFLFLLGVLLQECCVNIIGNRDNHSVLRWNFILTMFVRRVLHLGNCWFYIGFMKTFHKFIFLFQLSLPKKAILSDTSASNSVLFLTAYKAQLGPKVLYCPEW